MSTRGSAETTFYVICYDIPDDRRRAKIHAVLSGFGAWTQFSVFECYLTRQEVVILRARLADALNVREDTVRLYALCEHCQKRVEVMGQGSKPKEPTLYIS